MKTRRSNPIKLVTGLALCLLFTACKAEQPTGSTGYSPVRKEVVVNTPLFEFTPDNLNPWINGITHLRTFGVDFSKPKDADGLLQYVDDKRVDDFIAFSNAKGLKIIWTLNVGSRTLQTELAYVDRLIKKGMNIVAFEYGGEFYLPKYFEGDLSNHKVMEQIRMDGNHNDYLDLLDQWVPAFMAKYSAPEYEHILVCASHGETKSKRNEYRKLWNAKVFNWAEQHNTQEYTFSFSYHLYAGSNRSQGQPDEANVLLPGEVHWEFLNSKPKGGRWVCTESGYYVTDFSKEQLNLARQFYQAESNALGPDNVFGIHMLTKQTKKDSPLALYNLKGMTPVGKNFEQWLMKE